MQTPTVGRIVHYRLSESDCQKIAADRHQSGTRYGNPPSVGDVVPATVVRVFSPGMFNGQAALDGNDQLWLTSVSEGEGPGTWSWPPRA